MLGSLVWDRIYARDVRADPVEEWGGIAYALAALTAMRVSGWEIVPIVKIGEDLQGEAFGFMRQFPRLDLSHGVCVVPEENARVELRYLDGDRRCERLTGGVRPWTWTELAPKLQGLDAMYVNFISGFELELECAQRLGLAFQRPLYADIHSLLLGIGPGGRRQPRPLEDWRQWLSCFDVIQVNEDELGLLAQAWGDPWRFAADIVDAPDGRLRLLLVTLGGRGAAYVAGSSFRPAPLEWFEQGLGVQQPPGVSGSVRSRHVTEGLDRKDGDPTGCGDVWGSTCFVRLLAGDELEAAMTLANRMAARNVEYCGAAGLYNFLQGRVHQ